VIAAVMVLQALDGLSDRDAVARVSRTRCSASTASSCCAVPPTTTSTTSARNTLALRDAIDDGLSRLALVGMSCQSSVPPIMRREGPARSANQ